MPARKTSGVHYLSCYASLSHAYIDLTVSITYIKS